MDGWDGHGFERDTEEWYTLRRCRVFNGQWVLIDPVGSLNFYVYILHNDLPIMIQ